jgi:hypothetical protein
MPQLVILGFFQMITFIHSMVGEPSFSGSTGVGSPVALVATTRSDFRAGSGLTLSNPITDMILRRST